MGKMQELKEKLESLSIQRREKKSDDPETVKNNAHAETSKIETSSKHNVVNFPSGDSSSSSSSSSSLMLPRRPELELDEQDTFRPRRRLVSCKASMAGLRKARKEAENIIRMQSKLSVFVESEPNFGLKRTPLPDIRRSPRPDNEEDKKSDDGDIRKNLREKTARSFAIVEEENDLAAAPAICSSQSSIVALPSNEEVAIAYSPIPRERVSSTVSRSRYRVSRYVLDNDERPKTTPGKMDKTQQRQFSLVTETDNRKRTNHIISTFSNLLPRPSSKSQIDVHEQDNDDKKTESTRKKRASTITRNPSFRDEVVIPLPTHKLPPPIVKKRLRCSQCKKKLNITNTYTCRCGGMFCAIHRYSEVHNCMFDYKEEGRKFLQQTNPLVAAPKLPKI